MDKASTSLYELDTSQFCPQMDCELSVSTHPIQTTIKPDDENYKMNHAKRGKAVIFNHYKFTSPNIDVRKGTEIDCQVLKIVLEQIGFNVKRHDDLTRREIEDTLEDLSRQNYEEEDCLLIFVLTHGKGEKLCAHDKTYSIEDFYDSFTPHKCPTLAGKPKLFFINACRGKTIDHGVKYKYEIDDGPIHTYTVSSHADFLTVRSTTPAIPSLRNEQTGSLFVRNLCLVLVDNEHRKLELMEILKIVSRKTALEPCKTEYGIATQCPSMISTLIRNVYLERMSTENVDKSPLKRNAEFGEPENNKKV